MVQTELNFDVKEPDIKTLNGIVRSILLSDTFWWTPWGIQHELQRRGAGLRSDSCITARLRDLRKSQYGSHIIEKRKREGSRAYEYRLVQ